MEIYPRKAKALAQSMESNNGCCLSSGFCIIEFGVRWELYTSIYTQKNEFFSGWAQCYRFAPDSGNRWFFLCGKVNGKVDVLTGSAVSIDHGRGAHVPNTSFSCSLLH